MISFFAIVIAAVLLLSALLYFEKNNQLLPALSTKTALSALFIITAVGQLHVDASGYYHRLLIGLWCCLAGDALLGLKQKTAFTIGLFAFLAGHLFYIYAMLLLPVAGSLWTGAGIIVIVVIGVVIYLWLRPFLGSMNIPVLLYIVTISIMIGMAWRVCGGGLHVVARVMIMLGALSFYISDVFVARQRFVKDSFVNRAAGLPLYYLGQFLLAFSIGQVHL